MLQSEMIFFFSDGHSSYRKSLSKPAYCHHCSEVIWSSLSTGFACDVCNFLAHEKCLRDIVTICPSHASTQILTPVAHCWSELTFFRRKFCNVCRTRLRDTPSVRCEEYDQYFTSLAGGQPAAEHQCLTGYRCLWCGTTVHAGCSRKLPVQCDFGSLHNIMLPPWAVSLPRPDIPSEYTVGIMRRPQTRTFYDCWSSSEDSREESCRDSRGTSDSPDRDCFDDYACALDGEYGLVSRSFRSFSFSKAMSTEKAMGQCLKAFYLVGNPKDYTLYEMNEKDGNEVKLDMNEDFRTQLRFDPKRPTLIFRRECSEDPYLSNIRIYSGDLTTEDSGQLVELPLEENTTAQSIVFDAVQAFQKLTFTELDSSHLRLTMMSLNFCVSERILDPSDRPWNLLSTLRAESCRALQLTRFCLRRITEVTSADPPSSSSTTISAVPLFVGNLKENLSQCMYERLLTRKLGGQLKWESIEVIYYENGCFVLNFATFELAEKAYEKLRNAYTMERPLVVLILPKIQPHFIPVGVQPLLVFVNIKSGGCQGIELMTAFRCLLNPFQVFNLDVRGPLPGLLFPSHSVGQDAACHSPPIALLPLGNGNDLARVLNWGGGYTSAEAPLLILKNIVTAEEVRVDRWTLVGRSDEEMKDEVKAALHIQTNSQNTTEDNSSIVIMNNYLGIGIDADLALDFHNARSENPSKFNSRLHNKSVYFKMGLRKMVNRSTCKDLQKKVVVEADGRVLDLPSLEGILVLNILSWGGGANPWGLDKDETFAQPTHYDGLLEVVGICGVLHMGQIYSGFRSGIRLAQAAHLKIILKSELPIQVDGGPFVQPPGQLTVLRSALKEDRTQNKSRIASRLMSTESKATMLKRVNRGDLSRRTRIEDRQKSPLVSVSAITAVTGARTPALVMTRPTNPTAPLSDEEQGQGNGDDLAEREEGRMLETRKFGTFAPADLLSCPLAEAEGLGLTALLNIPDKS
ncbi:Diacylglycerol kinase theta [Taenia crassiceps]|uniref:Diacylglycerol kinase n=1 Tax=Taenia crassiceps TaxID=6207 RepID=A0ABR4QL47_9CEST